jgi:hypothetical protein
MAEGGDVKIGNGKLVTEIVSIPGIQNHLPMPG